MTSDQAYDGTRWRDEREAVLGRIDTLERKVAELTQPPPEPHRVLIGATVSTTPTWGGNWASLERAIGPLQAVRLFDPNQATPPATLFRNVAGKGLEIHSSTKSLSTNVGARQAYYEAVAATGEKVVAYTWHEPDDDMARGDFTYDEWRAAAITDARICTSLGIDYGICWQLFALTGFPALVDRLVNDDELLLYTKVMGWDTYQRGDTEFRKATYRPWSYNGDQITAVMARMPDHLQVAAPELGYPEHPVEAGYRPTCLIDMHAQAVREKWRAILIYNAFKIPDDPGDNWVSTGPEFCYDTPECRETSKAAMAGFVALGAPA